MYYYCDMVFLFIVVQGIGIKGVPDITFLIRNNSNRIEPICVIDKNILDSAIAWIYPIAEIKETLPTIVSKYIPEVENDYSCNFLKTKHCSSLWELKDWQFSKFDSHIFKPHLDIRWEDFPTLLTSNSVKEFKNRIDISHTFELGISIRGERNAEMFLCTGWDPYTYPCYYINVGGIDNQQVFLRKYKSIPTIMGKNDSNIDKYKSDDKLISPDEWRNLILSLSENGTLALIETFKNITLLNYQDNKALQPIYLFIRSKDSKALWKIHNNHYIFTNKSKLSQLGPTFTNYGDTLCVSLFVSMCRSCRMTFYIIIKGEMQIIKTVFNENDHDDFLWKEIKLLQHDVLEEKIKLFVETKYTNNTVVSDGFWAIDDVRLCSEDEIKISYLVSNEKWNQNDLQNISCQALASPTWRPTQIIFTNTKNEIEYSPTSTTIQISRKPQIEDEHHIQYYIVQYEGKDICNKPGALVGSLPRLKSQGIIIMRSNKIEITNLVPYTAYNIRLWNAINEIKVQRDVTTLYTDIPKSIELPKNVVMQATHSTCDILWEAPTCNQIFGPILYQVKVFNKNVSYSSIQTDIKTRYIFKDLQPMMDYNVEIATARKLDNFKDSNMSVFLTYNFTTTANETNVIDNFEVYATTKNSAHLRFDFSKTAEVQLHTANLRLCHLSLFNKCDSDVRELSHCKLWKKKFCIDAYNLTTGSTYEFFISIKNNVSSLSSAEAKLTAVIVERVPGIPSNVTYKMRNCVNTINCCNLNVSWVHPVNPNGSITMFDIVLTESSHTYVLDSYKSIHEVWKVAEKSYQLVYNHNIKYISCNIPYKISVRAVNDNYRGQFASTSIILNNKTDYVDPMPKYVNSTNETVAFTLPPDEYGLRGSLLIVVVQDYNKNKTKISDEIMNLEIFDDINELCNQFGETWLAKAVQINKTILGPIVIGDNTSSYVPSLNRTVINKRLNPNTEYCITFTITKRIKDSEQVIVYHDKNLFTESNGKGYESQNNEMNNSTNVAAYLLPILFITLLAVCGAWLSYRYFKKKRHGTNAEHAYEAMPFEDYLTDAISNDSYEGLNRE